MLAAIALMAASPSEPPYGRTPSFVCTPINFNIRAGLIHCHEGLSIKLWGMKFRRRVMTAPASIETLGPVFNAREARLITRETIAFYDALPMHCYSSRRDGTTVAQCFVRTKGVFGDEDLACLIIRHGLGAAIAFSHSYYSHCPPRSPKD